MRYCAPRGIPHSVFLTWHPDDQDKAISWMLDDQSKCPTCGTYPNEWLDEEGKLLDEPPWEAKTLLCEGCTALEEKRQDIPEKVQNRYHVYLAKAKPQPREA